jgi:hypothetical protein
VHLVEHQDGSLLEELHFLLADVGVEVSSLGVEFIIGFEFAIDEDGDCGLIIVDE